MTAITGNNAMSNAIDIMLDELGKQMPRLMLTGERLKDIDVNDEDMARYMNFISVKVIPHVST